MSQAVAQLVSLQVGKPKTIASPEGEWRSAIYKSPVSERLFLDTTNLIGDKQADLRHHGGADKAVCCFPAEHYVYWQEKLGLGEAFGWGAFGENFTLAGLTESDVCIGDVYAVGTAQVQVSQPRQPCNNLARKWRRQEMPEEMIGLGHTGYYLRVVQTGEVGPGDAVGLLERLYPDLTIALVNGARYRKAGGKALNDRLATLPELSRDWRWTFSRRTNFAESDASP